MQSWFTKHNSDLFPNILQVEWSKEAGYFDNSHISIDLYSLGDSLKAKLDGVKVGLRWKSI